MSRRVEIPHTSAPRGTCRWCGRAILKKDGTQNLRRRWHSECSSEYDFAIRPRWPIQRAEKEVCQACGLDTRAVERRLREEATTHLRGWYYAAHTQLGKMLMKQGFDVRRSLWDADHVVPLTDGGQFSRPWVWTLCQPCHKRKTAREAALRAAYRGRGSYLGGEGISYEDPSEAKAYWQRYLTGKKEQG